MENIAGFIYHHDFLDLKIFPAGKSSKIDWENRIDSENNFDFYAFVKSPEENTSDNNNQKPFIEYDINDDYNIEPLRLKETIRYKCEVISKKDDVDFKIHINNEENKFLKIERDHDDSFSFQYINYLGKSSLIIDDKNELPFEVVSNKFEYREDYVNLTEAIADECDALLLEYTSPTSLSFTNDPEKNYKTALEQFIFLRHFCYVDNFESLFASIKRNPDRILVKNEDLKPFGTGIISQKFFIEPFSNARGWNDTGEDFYLPSEISVTHKYDSFDTPANRFIKFALNVFQDICENIINYIDKSFVYYKEALSLKDYIEEVLQDSFFDDVNELNTMPVNNQVLEKREGYSQIFRAFSMVDLALQIKWEGKDDVFSGEAKNTALLYEYWLFFELRKIIKNIDGCKIIREQSDENLFIKDYDGLTILLKEGDSSVEYFEIDNLRINLYYNLTFSSEPFRHTKFEGSYSRPFRPDYTIAIYPKEYSNDKEAAKAGEVHYVHFDAKYRIEEFSQFVGSNNTEESSENSTKEEIKEEKEDSTTNTYKRGDLLKMHTYNDAIRRTIGSYVLYPGTDNNDEKNRFHVYEEILPGVGAFAIRPSSVDQKELNKGEEAVKKFIIDIINFCKTPASRVARTGYFENMVLESPSYISSQENINSSSDLTMIGFVKEDYYEYLKANGYLPKDSNNTSYEGKEFKFYFRAIESGKVYTLHKETMKAKYLRFTLKRLVDIKIKQNQKFEELEPWNSEIKSISLVSKEELGNELGEYSKGHTFHADYYYLVKAEFLHQYKGGIVAISTEENQIISPYSPKIVKLSEGNLE